MHHSIKGKQLSRNKNERRRLFRGLLRDLIIHGAIRTTITKAKAIQPDIDKLITKAKTRNESKRREIYQVLTDKVTTRLLWDDAVSRFQTRKSGYTRIVRIGQRRGDNAEEVLLSFVDERQSEIKKSEKSNKKINLSTQKTLATPKKDKKNIKK